MGAVLDLVYNPDPTRLGRRPQESAAFRRWAGTEMFAVQAARQSRSGPGVAPEIERVRRIVGELLEAGRR